MTGDLQITWRAYDRDGSADVEAWAGFVGDVRMFLLFDDAERGWCLTSRLGEPATVYPATSRSLGELLARELLLALLHTFGPASVRALIRKREKE